jgi:hypothetical protein
MADLVGIEVQDQRVAVKRRNLVLALMSAANGLGNSFKLI